ncbi:glycosyltransferase family 2 protein, partial [bacterium]|nr:glycosyltransferase family 2 protein [candidate division CSSED10-310 bacterium]
NKDVPRCGFCGPRAGGRARTAACMNPSRPDISIIIISTNECADLERCLQSIDLENESPRLEVFVVDNHSSDGTSAMVGDRFPAVRLIRNPRKYGFSTNNNLGILRCTGRYVLILNPDTILRDDTLSIMTSFMDEHPDVGAAGCRLVNPDGSQQYTARRFPTLLSVIFRWANLDRLFPRLNVLRHYLMMDCDQHQIRDVDWIIGAFLFVRHSVLEEVGPFDQRFDPLYIEDEDLCYRIKQNGYRVTYVPATEIVHAYNRESARGFFNRMTYIHFRNFLRFYIKHRRYRL